MSFEAHLLSLIELIKRVELQDVESRVLWAQILVSIFRGT